MVRQITAGQVFIERTVGNAVTVTDVVDKDGTPWVVAQQGVAYDNHQFTCPTDVFHRYYRSEPLAS